LRLVIQIPCLNEETTLPATLADLPTTLTGMDSIEILVIDDGSTDRTVEVAHELGVHRVTRFPANQGLARAFERGLQESLAMDADVIVNTDADNQYSGHDIGKLIQPILDGRADIVVGTRPIAEIDHFSPLKKALQKLGSSVVRRLSKTSVPDATSGFRAYSRNAALKLTVVTGFTYTLETLIQGSQKQLEITHVPIRTNPKTRDSRLFGSMGAYIQRSLGTMARVYLMYQPLKIFLALSTIFLVPAAVLLGRFLYFYFTTSGPTGHVQSLVLAGALGMIGVLVGALGILADLIATNRRLIEETLVHTRMLRARRSRKDDENQ